MFFIGGFNTVIPYLLYLCIIWAFMIIGLSGRIGALLPDSIFHADDQQIAIQDAPIQVLSAYDLQLHFSYDAENAEQSDLGQFTNNFSENIAYYTGPAPCRKSFSNRLFRGPPVSV